MRERQLIALAALGFLAGGLLLIASVGSNDIDIWRVFADAMESQGLAQLYQGNASFNHPPLMGYLALLALRVSADTAVTFPVAFKVLPMLANLGAALLLVAIWRQREGREAGARVLALYAWSLCPMLVGSYHGNTDSLCALGCLLCLYLLEYRRRPDLAGLALAAAINVKVIPLLFVLPLLATMGSWREALRFCAGLSTAAIPFLLAWWWAGNSMITNIFAYGSNVELWGPYFFFSLLQLLPDVSQWEAVQVKLAYHAVYGKYAVIAAIGALAVFTFRRDLEVSRAMGAAVAIFLLLAPGFALQYTAYLAPFAFAISLRWGWWYSLAAGLFIGSIYYYFLLDVFPLDSEHSSFPRPFGVAGFALWLLVAGFLRSCLRGAPDEDQREAAPAAARPAMRPKNVQSPSDIPEL